MEIIKRLAEIQKNLKAPKNQRNTFGNYNYRNCEDILEAVKPLLLDDEVVVLQDEVVNIGNRNYVKATATLQKEIEQMSSTAYACESEVKKGMDSAQITGASSSYARKYALNGLFAIDDTKDADSQDNTTQVNSSPPVATPRPATQSAPPSPVAQQMNQGMQEQQEGMHPCEKCGNPCKVAFPICYPCKQKG